MRPTKVLITIFLLAIALQKNVDGGSAGVKNGTVRGLIHLSNKQPVSGVVITLLRQEQPPIIRSTISDNNGHYAFYNVPVGKYNLEFSKLGFSSIKSSDSNSNNSSNRTHSHVYVESGALVTVPPTTLRSLGAFGRTEVKIRLIDQITGETIEKASLTLGNQATNSVNSAGEFNLSLNFPPTDQNIPKSKLSITSPGFENLTDTIPTTAGQTNSFLIPVMPKMGLIEGTIDFSQFPQSNLNTVTNIQISNISADILDAEIDPSGHFSVAVPVSTESNLRLFDLRIHTRGFQPVLLKNITAPFSGASTLIQPVRLVAITKAVSGAIVTGNGASPVPSGLNQAFIKELGISSAISNGKYQFQAVPVGVDLTLHAFIMNRIGRVEKIETTLKVTENGRDIFVLPTLITQSAETLDNIQP